MILSTRDPQCVLIEPRTALSEIDISYNVNGVNEDQVSFFVSVVYRVYVDSLSCFMT